MKTTFKLSEKSLERLAGVHPDLVRIVRRAIELTPIDFKILEGIRTIARQRQLLASGATKTLNSRHLTGHAVDIAPLERGRPSWHWPHYHVLAEAIFAAARHENIEIEWGGHWKSFPDGPHWQLPWKTYPLPKT